MPILRKLEPDITYHVNRLQASSCMYRMNTKAYTANMPQDQAARLYKMQYGSPTPFVKHSLLKPFGSPSAGVGLAWINVMIESVNRQPNANYHHHRTNWTNQACSAHTISALHTPARDQPDFGTKHNAALATALQHMS